MASRRKSRSTLRHRVERAWPAFAAAALACAILAYALYPLVSGSAMQRTLVELLQRVLWSGAGVCAVTALGAYAYHRYAVRKANPYARLRLPREPQFDSPHFGRRAAALAVGEPVIRIRELPKVPPVDRWSPELLRALEWKHFDLLCAAYYRHRHFRVESSRCAPDGGSEAKLYFKDLATPVALLSCKAWGGRPVGVKPVRDLLEAMTDAGVAKGIFHASGDCTNEARAYARAHRIQLVSGSEFVAQIQKLPHAVQKALLDLTTAGDYTTPTCPACGEKMVMCTADSGDFWGCSGYPTCKATLAAVHASW